jgi:hypothetical protein
MTAHEVLVSLGGDGDPLTVRLLVNGHIVASWPRDAEVAGTGLSGHKYAQRAALTLRLALKERREQNIEEEVVKTLAEVAREVFRRQKEQPPKST